MTDVYFRYAHFIGILLLASMLVLEHYLLRGNIARQQLQRAAIIDGIYGASAVVILIAGLLLWFKGVKSPEFYNLNWIFHAKLTLFLITALISIYPTVWLIRNRRREQASFEVPKAIVMIIRFELLLLIIIPLLAVLMARGIGLA